MSYTPQPGSVPARVIEYLQGFAPGDEFPTGVLCQRLMITSASLITSMEAAKRNGLVKSHKAGKTTMWSLGDGTPEAGPDAGDIRVPKFDPAWKPPTMTPPRGEAPRPAAAAPSAPPTPSPAPTPVPAPQSEPELEPAEALASDDGGGERSRKRKTSSSTTAAGAAVRCRSGAPRSTKTAASRSRPNRSR